MREGFRESSLGLPPVIQVPQVDLSQQNVNIILERVRARIQSAFVDEDLPKLIIDKNVKIAIANAIETNKVTWMDVAVKNISDAFVQRIRHARRLQSIKDNPIRLQPRGCTDIERGSLPTDTIHSHRNTKYSSFIATQRKYRL